MVPNQQSTFRQSQNRISIMWNSSVKTNGKQRQRRIFLLVEVLVACLHISVGNYKQLQIMPILTNKIRMA